MVAPRYINHCPITMRQEPTSRIMIMVLLIEVKPTDINNAANNKNGLFNHEKAIADLGLCTNSQYINVRSMDSSPIHQDQNWTEQFHGPEVRNGKPPPIPVKASHPSNQQSKSHAVHVQRSMYLRNSQLPRLPKCHEYQAHVANHRDMLAPDPHWLAFAYASGLER